MAIDGHGKAWAWGNLPGSLNPPAPEEMSPVPPYATIETHNALWVLCGRVRAEGEVICSRVDLLGFGESRRGFGVPFP